MGSYPLWPWEAILLPDLFYASIVLKIGQVRQLLPDMPSAAQDTEKIPPGERFCFFNFSRL
ncbi:MAG: hypothetical protein ACK2T4_05345 [Candidatus Promineifilaceae bacterium]|jgi:hypothetical protein